MSSDKQMTASKHVRFTPNPLSHLVTSLALVSCLGGAEAMAQEIAQASSTPVAASGGSAAAEVQVIDVMGTRQAEESAINRKKKAKTAMDSIVAEDVGTLPDKNVGEAISRVAGIALDRGDMGEGVGITIRGNTPDLTRVEIDGQAVQSPGGASGAMNGDLAQGGSGRAQGFRDLPSDLIKSVDVIKGSTADMNEGSLGGGVQVKTRSALDFNKRYGSITVSETQGSLNTETQPSFNFVGADKFFDDRFGILVNGSAAKVTNESHNVQNTANGFGLTHMADFDNSAEKTFAFNPSTLSTTDPVSTTPFATYALKSGGTYSAATPKDFLTKSAAAQTKQDCYTAFPAFTTTELANFSTTTIANTARGQRNAELMACLNQWNDWTPTLVRYGVKRDYEDRKNLDVRFDFKVNDDLSLYTKLSTSRRDIDNTFETYTLGPTPAIGGAVTSSVPYPALTSTYAGPAYTDTNGVRTAVANSGYYTLANNVSGSTTVNNGITNTVVNVIPSSVVVDSTHHVTDYSYTNGASTTDQIESNMAAKVDYAQLGGTYTKDNLLVEFMAGDAKNTLSRIDRRISYSTYYGNGSAHLNKSGLWTFDTPTINQGDASVYGQLSPVLATNKTQQNLYGTQMGLTQLSLNEGEELTGKVDVTYKLDDKLSFFTDIKSGLNYRETSGRGWGQGGYTQYQDSSDATKNIYVPNNKLRTNISICENTTASGSACVYGYTPQTAGSSRAGNIVISQAQYQAIVASTLMNPTANFFNGKSGYISAWKQIDVEKAYKLFGMQNDNFNCIKHCAGTDGKTYDQPYSAFSEDALAGYLMADFDFKDLPLGMEATSNIGVRAVQNDLDATGWAVFVRKYKNSAFDPNNPTAAAGYSTAQGSRKVEVARSTTDVLPSFNFALWAIPDEVVVRYSRGTTVARPGVPQLLPAGTCTYDDSAFYSTSNAGLNGEEIDMACSTFGNPALKAQRSLNQNLNVEWYPNKGYMFSAAVFSQDSKVGAPMLQSVSDQKPFAGTDVVDPYSGLSLANQQYSYKTYLNGPGINKKGIEISFKAALDFLPGILKYTGIDGNSSILNSDQSVTVHDLNTGDKMPNYGESAYAYNLALWYDDGHLTGRIAYQARGESFTNLTGLGTTSATQFNYPADGVTVTRFPYNPSGPIFKDATAFIDAQIAYKFDMGMKVFLEARNLGNAIISTSSSGYSDYSNGAPNLYDQTYYGRKIIAGFNYKF